uniref:Uncharacterized protein n=1 Tax=Anguilla anguilla TaxID=7936 RepID=A0A0E9TZL9_ANGAN
MVVQCFRMSIVAHCYEMFEEKRQYYCLYDPAELIYCVHQSIMSNGG